MSHKICIIGSKGFIGKELRKNLKLQKINFIEINLPRPDDDKRLASYYINLISKILTQIKNCTVIINCAGSINCKKKHDFFFNSNFDVLFQNYLVKKKLKIKYISINSTKIFGPWKDLYSISKKKLHNNFKNSKLFISIYPDLIIDTKSNTYKKIKIVLKKIKTIPLPIFNPGKTFYPLDNKSFVQNLIKIALYKNKKFKYIIMGKKKISFYQLISKINKKEKLNRYIKSINKKWFKYLPLKLLKLLYQNNILQNFDDIDYIKEQMKNEFSIIKCNFQI